MVNNGRPTQSQQAELEEKFHECYLCGFGAIIAAKKVGTDKKTAYRYYNIITKEITKERKKDFFKRVRQNLEQMIQSLDFLLVKYYGMLEPVEEKLAHSDKFNPQLNHYMITILKEIRSTLNEKAILHLELPLDESLPEMIEEEIKKYAKSH